MDDYKFFAFLDRLKYISRWSLMRNTREENVAEHAYITSLLAHSLCEIQNALFGGNLNADRAAAIALYHEAAESLTGDLPTPVKYFNDEIRLAYKRIEKSAETQILASLPLELQAAFAPYVQPDKAQAETAFVKYADKLAAYIKCVQECNCGNKEFEKAEKSVFKELKSFNNFAVEYFLTHFLTAFTMNLDDMTL